MSYLVRYHQITFLYKNDLKIVDANGCVCCRHFDAHISELEEKNLEFREWILQENS